MASSSVKTPPMAMSRAIRKQERFGEPFSQQLVRNGFFDQSSLSLYPVTNMIKDMYGISLMKGGEIVSCQSRRG
jgi:hypothetical protein